MIKPQFPYLNNQLIISSDRVLLHSKTDAIFLFGKGAVSLSSPATINLDSSEKVLIDSPKIELGSRAEEEGEPVVLGRSLNTQLIAMLTQLEAVGLQLNCVSDDPKELGAAMQSIRNAGDTLYQEAARLKLLLSNNSPILSNTTYTK